MSILTITMSVTEKEFALLQDKVPEIGTWSVIAHLDSNRLEVMLSLDEEDYARAERMAEEGGFFGAADYVNGELFRAELEIEEILDNVPPPLFPFVIFLPPENGGAKDDDEHDLNDGIPF